MEDGAGTVLRANADSWLHKLIIHAHKCLNLNRSLQRNIPLEATNRIATTGSTEVALGEREEGSSFRSHYIGLSK